jgi:hypothetical protein
MILNDKNSQLRMTFRRISDRTKFKSTNIVTDDLRISECNLHRNSGWENWKEEA